MQNSPLAGSQQLAHAINNNKELIIFDCSWHMPDTQKDAKQEYLQQHIPGALFFDFDKEICDHNSSLPHMLPNETDFTNAVQKLGVNKDSWVVCYDSAGIFTSPRVWWMFQAMGHTNVSVLNGGLPGWLQQNMPTEQGQITTKTPGNFIARLQNNLVANASDVPRQTNTGQQLVIDARSPERFSGAIAEPGEGIRSGHIPLSCNLHYQSLLNNGEYRSDKEITAIMTTINPENKSLICSCGSGVTACIIALAAYMNNMNYAVYDGSWTEWGADKTLPVEQKV